MIWYIYKDLSESDKSNIVVSFKEADYFWIGISALFAILSHVSRAMRWVMVIKTLGYKPKLANSFFAVMIGYLINMVFPRLGEVSRCASMSKYEKVPFENLFGTVIAERMIDMLILLVLTLFTIFMQIDILGEFVTTEILNPVLLKLNHDKMGMGIKLLYLVVFLSGFFALMFILKRKSKGLFDKIKGLWIGFGEGFKTVLKVKNPALFVFHSLFIWLMYYATLHVSFFALKETSGASVMAVLSSMVFGSFGIIAVQGGLGAYPLIVSKTLTLFGIALPIGFAFGWIVWTAQFLMILVLGLLSIALIPGYNKQQDKA